MDYLGAPNAITRTINSRRGGRRTTTKDGGVMKAQPNPADYEITAAAAEWLPSCPTPCDPIDGSAPGAPVPGTLQARTLQWAAISLSNTGK